MNGWFIDQAQEHCDTGIKCVFPQSFIPELDLVTANGIHSPELLCIGFPYLQHAYHRLLLKFCFCQNFERLHLILPVVVNSTILISFKFYLYLK